MSKLAQVKDALVEQRDAFRWLVYAATLVGSPLVGYANAKAWVGADEVMLWAAEVTAASTLAATHVRDVVKKLRAQAERG